MLITLIIRFPLCERPPSLALRRDGAFRTIADARDLRDRRRLHGGANLHLFMTLHRGLRRPAVLLAPHQRYLRPGFTVLVVDDCQREHRALVEVIARVGGEPDCPVTARYPVVWQRGVIRQRQVDVFRYVCVDAVSSDDVSAMR